MQPTTKSRLGKALDDLPHGRTTRRRRVVIWGGLVLALGGSLFILYATWQQEVADLRNVVQQVALEEGLDPRLIEAIVEVESGGNPTAVSPAKAYGLMQLRLPTAGEVAGRPVTEQDLFDPRLNVQLGCRYLRKMLRRFGNDLRLALMAYNAGPGNVDRWLAEERDPVRILRELAFRETRNYVHKIDRHLRSNG